MLYLASLVFAFAPDLPQVGQPAPDFKAAIVNADSVAKLKGKKEISLEDLKGRNVVLFFYPKAMTRG